MSQIKNIGIVLYTDGSAQPNPGCIGSGAHGYTYSLLSQGAAQKSIKGGYFATSKGYCKVDQTQSGEPVVITNYIDFLSSSTVQGTNNRAELIAFIRCVQNILTLEFCDEVHSVHFLVDSEYVQIGVMQRNEGWSKTQWMGMNNTPVANSDLWKLSFDVVNQLKAKGIELSIGKVKAHSDALGNDQADWLSAIARSYSESGEQFEQFTITKASKKYWDCDTTAHPFMGFKRIYFNSQKKLNISGQYFMTDPGAGDAYIGNRNPETGFAVVVLGEPDKVVEAVKQRQLAISGDYNYVVMMYLDRLYDKSVFPYVDKFGQHALFKNKRGLSVDFADQRPITTEVNPSRLSPRALQAFNFLEDVLVSVQGSGRSELNGIDFQSHDITDVLYEINEKGKTQFRKEYVVGFKSLSVEVEKHHAPTDKLLTIKVPLLMGLDMPERNKLKHLEEYAPCVKLITWATSPECFRYCIYIQCSNASGVWSNYFSDRVFLSIDKKLRKAPK